MTIYEALKKDHREVDGLLEKLTNAETAEARRTCLEQIRDALIPHARAEEAVFYNTLRDLGETKADVSHAYREHLKIETLLRGLQVSESVALNWQNGVKALKEAITHHVQEEETNIFEAAKKALIPGEDEAIGKAFAKLKPQMGAGVMASNVELVANLLPERFRKHFVERLKSEGDARKAG